MILVPETLYDLQPLSCALITIVVLLKLNAVFPGLVGPP